MHIGQIVRRNAWTRPRQPSFTCGRDSFDWRSTNDRVNKLAAYLGSRIGDGSRVAILSPTCHRYFETHFALAKAGLVGVPVNHRLDGPEVAQILRDSGATALLFSREVEAPARYALRAGAGLLPIGWGEGEQAGEADFETILATAPAAPEPDRAFSVTDLYVLGYTSGTTGAAKGAMVSHQATMSGAWAYAQALGLRDTDRVLACMPGYVYRGGSGGYAPALAGAHTIVAPFEADRVSQLLTRESVTQVTLAPVMAERVLDEVRRQHLRFPALRNLWLTGSPARANLLTGLMAELDAEVGVLYGLTEATAVAMIRHSPDRPDLLGSVGRTMGLLDVELRDDSGTTVSVGEVGQLYVRGDSVAAGYWNAPELTATALHNGWFATGDYGRLNQEGHLFLVDRRADIIVSGGINVYSSELEAILIGHPSVADVAVVGAPDDRWGETPVAFLVGSDLDPPEVAAWLRTQLAGFKQPRDLFVLDRLPRNAMGKVDKRALREPLWAGYSTRISG